ncbi:DNA polymerase alpha/epsilon subunit B-domain-containing protein [Lyophyllum atratum]|nr:DNA polymerase alpha/epsilon subunit B-domain-containing protein [Lyophyllum atratum]
MSPLDPIPAPPVSVRLATVVLDPAPTTPSFQINTANKSYKYQYSNIYFIRLRLLRQCVEERAHKRWGNIAGNPILVPRVLEVVKSRLCYIIGTVYMDMPLKPNVMEDIARDHSIPPPPPNRKFYSPEDNVMLEDESGRIRLVGERVKGAKLVTGVIVAALGAETPNGDFEVVDLCYPGMAPQTSSEDAEPLEEKENGMDVDDPQSSADEWIAVVSGLDIGSTSSCDAQIQMLVEYLTGEEGGMTEQISATQISRLIIAGNSLSPLAPNGKGESADPEQPQRKSKRYGYDVTTFSPHPVLSLSDHLLDIAGALPIHILPGESDPSGMIMPQQAFPKAMFGAVAKLPTFSCETNPTYLRVGCQPQLEGEVANHVPIERTLLVNSGQPLNDMFKYLPSPPNTRLSILESTLKWRHMAPTAPDTLWCHPYFGGDPFIITETPDLYIVGNQKRFGTKIVVDEDENGEGSKARCRVVMVPEFARTGVLVLVNLRSLNVKTVTFGVQGMAEAGVSQPEAAPLSSPHDLEPASTAPKHSVNFDFY